MVVSPVVEMIRTPHRATRWDVLKIVNGVSGLSGQAAPKSVGVAPSRGSEKWWWRRTLEVIHASDPTCKRQVAISMSAPSIASGMTGVYGAHAARVAMADFEPNSAARNPEPPMVDCRAWEMPPIRRSATQSLVLLTAPSNCGTPGVIAPPHVAWEPVSAPG